MTSSPLPSLLDRPAQADLDLGHEHAEPTSGALLEVGRPSPLFTGARLFANHPDDYQRIASMLAEGANVSEISRVTRHSRNVVAAVLRRERASCTVEQLQHHAAQRYGHIADLASDRAEDELTSESCDTRRLKDLVAAAVAATDKAELLSGKPTARTAGAVELPSVADAAAMLDMLRLTDLGGEKDGCQKNGAPAAVGDACLVSPGPSVDMLACALAQVVEVSDR